MIVLAGLYLIVFGLSVQCIRRDQAQKARANRYAGQVEARRTRRA
jgi:hypothetical protein